MIESYEPVHPPLSRETLEALNKILELDEEGFRKAWADTDVRSKFLALVEKLLPFVREALG